MPTIVIYMWTACCGSMGKLVSISHTLLSGKGNVDII